MGLLLSTPLIHTAHPVALNLGFVQLRWYPLAYIAGLLLSYALIKKFVQKKPQLQIRVSHLESLLTWCVIAIVVGGRLGYVFFYMPHLLIEDPLSVLKVWQGGMAFHGGVIGVFIALVVFCHIHQLKLTVLTDLMAMGLPIGLFLGRLANFANGELYGRLSTLPWAMVFERGGPYPRHPSQLYEAFLEGLAMACLINFLAWRTSLITERSGFLTGLSFIFYGVARFIAEFFREPDAHIGYLYQGLTQGQLLTLPLFFIGCFFIKRSFK